MTKVDLKMCTKIKQKQLVFRLIILYSVIFASCIFYFYGSNFLPVLKLRHNIVYSIPVEQDIVLEFDDDANSSTVLVHHHVDVHLEDPVLGHTGDTQGHHEDSSNHFNGIYDGKTVVAIGGGITSAKLSGVEPHNIGSKFQFFSIMLPSFCDTATKSNYHYSFYLAYDLTDAVFTQKNFLDGFQSAFDALGTTVCSSISMDLHFVQCQHSGHPAWAQNDAMLEAYLDGAEYFYRINDDSVLVTSGWTDAFVDTLASYTPPYLGVVGPQHSGGNELILTYDFVHRTHVDVFGFYYPRIFPDWFADGWITKVYLPDHSTKLRHIRIKHTMRLGQRYKNDYSLHSKLAKQVKMDKIIVERYKKYRTQASTERSGHSKMIALSLYGKDPRYTWGAIRNAQLMPVVFPGWTLRVYVPMADMTGGDLIVPPRIIACLKRLGVQVVHVNSNDTGAVPPRWWRYLVADDISVEYFLIRDADSRLNQRDAAAVNDWIESKENVHCIRDQPSHASLPVVDGLWGGRPKDMQSMLGGTMHSRLLKFFVPKNVSSSNEDNSKHFLTNVLWPLISSQSICHDSVSCRNWNRTLSFPVEVYRSDVDENLGQTFTQHHVIENTVKMSALAECSGRGKVVFNGLKYV